MRLLAHGIDMVECARLDEMIRRHGRRFLERVFTETELSYCLGRKREVEHLAGRFAAKEAVLKVLGTGWRKGINWTDIEVVNEPSGQPKVRLSGRCREVADQMQIAEILISITHISTHAVASAVAAGGGESALGIPNAPPKGRKDVKKIRNSKSEIRNKQQTANGKKNPKGHARGLKGSF